MNYSGIINIVRSLTNPTLQKYGFSFLVNWLKKKVDTFQTVLMEPCAQGRKVTVLPVLPVTMHSMLSIQTSIILYLY